MFTIEQIAKVAFDGDVEHARVALNRLQHREGDAWPRIIERMHFSDYRTSCPGESSWVRLIRNNLGSNPRDIPECRDPIVPGAGATLGVGTDRYPYTIVEVRHNKRGDIIGVIAQRDDYRVVEGSSHDGSAEYEFTPNPDATEEHFTKRKDKAGRGSFVRKGCTLKSGVGRLSITGRSAYRDPHF